MGDSDRFQGRRVAGWHSRPGWGIVAGLNFELYSSGPKQAVFRVRLEVTVRSERCINESSMLTWGQLSWDA